MILRQWIKYCEDRVKGELRPDIEYVEEGNRAYFPASFACSALKELRNISTTSISLN